MAKKKTTKKTKMDMKTGLALGDIWAGFALLSRVPVPDLGESQDKTRGEPKGDSAWAWPIVGGCLGAISGIIGLIFIGLGLPVILAAAIAVAVLIGLCGALHEDGLADFADGFGGGKDKKTTLAIMKDSRLGSYGTIALVMIILVRVLALGSVGAGNFLPALIVIGAVSRLPMGWAMAGLPPARADGLSAGVGAPSIFALFVGSLIGLFMAIVFFGLAGIVIFALSIMAGLPVLALAWRRIDGQTGDVLGASQQCCEAMGYIAVVLFFGI